MSFNERRPPLGRVPELDGLRGVAILLVLVVHFFSPEPTGRLATAIHGVVTWFWLGVDLFFVLSGYLITRILLVEIGRPGAMADFYWRRALRILPAYGFCLLLTGVIYLTLHVSPPEWPWRSGWYEDSFLRLMTFTYNLRLTLPAGAPESDGPVGHLWSLSVEEQFYLFWPWLVLLVPLAVVRRLSFWLIGLAVLGKIAFAYARVDGFTTYEFTLTRMDGLLAGALVAVAAAQGRPLMSRRQARWAALLSVPVVAALCASYDENGATHFLVLFPPVLLFSVLGFTALVVMADQGDMPKPLSRLLSGKTLTWIGARSYGMYLLHIPILFLVHLNFNPALQQLSELLPWVPSSMTGNRRLFMIGLIITWLTFAAAHVMYERLEKPVMRWGRTRKIGLPGRVQS